LLKNRAEAGPVAGAPPGDISRRGSRGRAGFTLIEALVALAIAALGLGALMAAAGQGLGNVAAADHFIEATRRAQSRLAIAEAGQGPGPGEASGDDGGGYSWRVTIQRVAAHSQVAGSGAPQALALYAVGVTVSWREKSQIKSVSIQSERVWPAAGAHG
jgi:prepilin-type N-terminal cleavage/methylation domain-containing protein